MDIFRDPIWQFVGAIIGAIAIYAAIAIYKRQKGIRKVNCEIIYYSHILNIDEKDENKLLLYFGGDPVEEACLIIFIVYNAGTMSIRSADYEGPISISFGEGTKILNAEITWTRPTGIPARISFSPERLLLRPTLLNPGDIVALKAIVNKAKGEFEINSRIAGIKQIRKTWISSRNKVETISKILYASLCWFLTGLLLALTELVGNIIYIIAIPCLLYALYLVYSICRQILSE